MLIQEKKKRFIKMLIQGEKKELIWNQGLKEDFFLSDIKPEKAFKSCAHTSSSWISGPCSPRGRTGLRSQKGLSPQR